MKRLTELDRHVGQRLKAARVMSKKTQSQVADAIGVTHQQMSKIEDGKNRISASALVVACECMGISAGDLMAGLQAKEVNGTPLRLSVDALTVAGWINAIHDEKQVRQVRGVVATMCKAFKELPQ